MDVQNGSHVHHMEYEHQSHFMYISMFHELILSFLIYGIFISNYIVISGELGKRALIRSRLHVLEVHQGMKARFQQVPSGKLTVKNRKRPIEFLDLPTNSA